MEGAASDEDDDNSSSGEIEYDSVEEEECSDDAMPSKKSKKTDQWEEL